MSEQYQNLEGEFLGFRPEEPEYPLARSVVLSGVQISRENVQDLSKMVSDFTAIAVLMNNAIVDIIRAFQPIQASIERSLQTFSSNEDFQQLAKKNLHRARYERRYRNKGKYYSR